MTCALRGLPLLFCAAALCAQTPASPPPAGLESEWEIAVVMRQIGDNAAKMLSLIDQIDVKPWVEKGASDTYLAQWQSSKEQAKAAADGAKALAQDPERLAASLELFFRVQALESMMTSLAEGIRKYQNPADAMPISQAVTISSVYRNRLQQYVVNLAAEREQELKVMDREAQRCRAIVTLPPPKSGRKK